MPPVTGAHNKKKRRLPHILRTGLHDAKDANYAGPEVKQKEGTKRKKKKPYLTALHKTPPCTLYTAGRNQKRRKDPAGLELNSVLGIEMV